MLLHLALGLSIVVLIAVAVGPRTGTYRTVSVLTGSMQPTMPPGSLLVVVPVEPASLAVGDVITFEAPTVDHPVVTHRIVQVLESGEHPVIRTQGDANDAPDAWVARISEAPAWRVAMVVPQAGRAISFLRGPLPRTLAIYVTPLLILLLMMWNIWSRPAMGEVCEV
ncbi:MAG: signal peptidase I [Acidimicrobiales bacterium]